MGQSRKPFGWKRWALCAVPVACSALGIGLLLPRGSEATHANRAHAQESRSDEDIPSRVEVIQPTTTNVDRIMAQPGTIQAYETVQLFAGVSGYLKTQTVDIGAAVKKGQVLATVDVPDLVKQVQRFEAGVEQARARVLQMKAHLASARAELNAAKVYVPQAEALARSKAAELRFRERQLERMRTLAASGSVDERLVDEKLEQRDAAREAEISAREGVTSSKARVAAMEAKVMQADADIAQAEAEVKVSQADVEKAEVMVRFATLAAPFDGVVTQRHFFVGDYVRAPNPGSAQLPLLTVQRIDRFRAVVQVPDRDIPYVDIGDKATVEIDALPGEKFPACVSRLAQSEDPQTRLMHVEIDLPNSAGKIRHGMYGRVAIVLDRVSMLTLPSSCLVGKSQDGKGKVMVVRDGRIRVVPVVISADNGVRVGVISGLTLDDQVVRRPGDSLEEGAEVMAVQSAGVPKP